MRSFFANTAVFLKLISKLQLPSAWSSNLEVHTIFSRLDWTTYTIYGLMSVSLLYLCLVVSNHMLSLNPVNLCTAFVVLNDIVTNTKHSILLWFRNLDLSLVSQHFSKLRHKRSVETHAASLLKLSFFF